MCIYPICSDLYHLELFHWDRTGITNVLEGSLCYCNEGTSLIVYSAILSLPLVVLNGFNAWKWWIRYTAPTYMNTLMYPLNLVGWQGSQVIAHAKALTGNVNTASLNLPTGQGGPVWFRYDFVWLKLPRRSPICNKVRIHLYILFGGITAVF